MTNSNSLVLRKQMLEDRINNIATELEISQDEAFSRLGYALLFDTEYDDPDFDTDLVDGSGDKQIDIIRIEEYPNYATVHILQLKNSPKYKGTVMVQLRDGLDWVFKRPEEQYSNLQNKDLIIKISAIRKLSAKLGLRNLEVIVHYIGKGNTEKLSPDFIDEIQITKDSYAGGADFREFEIKIWGVQELIEKSYEVEELSRKIDVNLPFYMIWNAPTYLLYQVHNIEAVICTVDGLELANLVEKYGKNLFEENVRMYLGTRKKINAQILETCSKDDEAEYFWFFNNGITVTCDEFDVAYNANPPIIKIENMQIVNGCQTSMTLAEARKNGALSENVKILLKIFATSDSDFVDKITLTTNSQNAVSTRDLRSNDIYQRDLEHLFSTRGYRYERKTGAFRRLSKKEKQKVISNEKLGQAYLAIIKHYPAIAMSQKSNIWSAYYKEIYTSRIDELLAAYLIHDYCVQQRKTNLKSEELSSIEIATLKYGTFHLSRILGSYTFGEHWKGLENQILLKFILDVEQDSSTLDEKYKQAIRLLNKVVQDLAGEDMSRLLNIFKSTEIQKTLDKSLSEKR